MRWVFAALGVAVVAAGAVLAFAYSRDGGSDDPVVLPEHAMPGRLLVGFQDDASFRWAPDRAVALDAARNANAGVIRAIVTWKDAATSRPASPRDSFDPAYHFDDLDDLVRSGQQRGIELLLSIWGTPEWANGGQTPNHPPTDAKDLEDFAYALADRYSGRHAGYPAVRLFTAWNEPNLEQFLAPQFDEAGQSVSPALYAEIARAIDDGVKEANPDALVAIGETSPRGQDRPSFGTVQDSHSPARFARLVSEERPRLRFDAWAQHPYPPRPGVAPAMPVRWPRVAMGNLERFGESLDSWFDRSGTPIWVTEYGHETVPDAAGISLDIQAQFAEEALALAGGNPRVRLLIWFTLVDRVTEPWQSGLIAADATLKPSYARFAAIAADLDPRNPVLPSDAEVARVPALELAYYVPAGAPIEVTTSAGETLSVPLGEDGWLDVPIASDGPDIVLTAADEHGHSVERVVQLGSDSTELD
jgi:Cellulase (glycosyl hydrolase family 5)